MRAGDGGRRRPRRRATPRQAAGRSLAADHAAQLAAGAAGGRALPGLRRHAPSLPRPRRAATRCPAWRGWRRRSSRRPARWTAPARRRPKAETGCASRPRRETPAAAAWARRPSRPRRAAARRACTRAAPRWPRPRLPRRRCRRCAPRPGRRAAARAAAAETKPRPPRQRSPARPRPPPRPRPATPCCGALPPGLAGAEALRQAAAAAAARARSLAEALRRDRRRGPEPPRRRPLPRPRPDAPAPRPPPGRGGAGSREARAAGTMRRGRLRRDRRLPRRADGGGRAGQAGARHRRSSARAWPRPRRAPRRAEAAGRGWRRPTCGAGPALLAAGGRHRAANDAAAARAQSGSTPWAGCWPRSTPRHAPGGGRAAPVACGRTWPTWPLARAPQEASRAMSCAACWTRHWTLANRRLRGMLDGRYAIRRREEPDRAARRRAGHRGAGPVERAPRPAATLSGGEGFCASLALALGLAETVRRMPGHGSSMRCSSTRASARWMPRRWRRRSACCQELQAGTGSSASSAMSPSCATDPGKAGGHARTPRQHRGVPDRLRGFSRWRRSGRSPPGRSSPSGPAPAGCAPSAG